MTKEDILKEQIKELEKLLDLKSLRIQVLEKVINENFLFPKTNEIIVPTICKMPQGSKN